MTKISSRGHLRRPPRRFAFSTAVGGPDRLEARNLAALVFSSTGGVFSMVGGADSGYPDQPGVTSATIQSASGTGTDIKSYEATQAWDPQYDEQGTITVGNEPRTDVGGTAEGFTVNGNFAFSGTVRDPIGLSDRGSFGGEIKGQQNFTISDNTGATPTGTVTEHLEFNAPPPDQINREGSSLQLNSTYLNVTLGAGVVAVNVSNGATITEQTVIDDPSSFGTTQAMTYSITVVAPVTTPNQQVGFNYDANFGGQMYASMNYSASFALGFSVSY